MSDSEDEVFFDAQTDSALHSVTVTAVAKETFVTNEGLLTEQKILPSSCSSRPDLVLVFGPSNSYFFNSKRHWNYHPNPSQKDRAAIIQEWRRLPFWREYLVALVPTGGWCVAHTTDKGALAWNFRWMDGKCPKFGRRRKEWKERHAAYEELQAWLSTNICNLSDILQSTVTFGPERSYYARSPKATRSHDLPSDLNDEILKKATKGDEGAPRLVALGKDGAWAALWPDGTCTWNLIKDYVSLHNQLSASVKDKGVRYLALNPYRSDIYFVLWNNGHWAYEMGSTARSFIRPHVEQYAKDLAREKNATWTLTSGGVQTKTIFADPIEQVKADTLQLQQENLELQIKAAKASIAASKVAIGAGVVATPVLCELM